MPTLHGRQDLSPDEIRDEMTRILESPEFVASRQLALFLRYVVDESLAGRGDSIKQRNVALRALERDASFNPRKDPVVRIVAGKLRRVLDKYYASDGVGNHLRIELPKGTYCPQFRRASASRAAPRSLNELPSHLTPAQLSCTQRPTIAVTPFIAFSRGAYERHIADSLAQDICVQLSRYSWLEVTDFLTARNLSTRNPAPSEIASRLHADFFLSGTIRKREGVLRVTVQLADTAFGRIIWAERFTIPADTGELRGQDDIVERVAARLGDLYGILATAVIGRARRKAYEQVTLCEMVLANLRYQSQLADGLFANAFQRAEHVIRTDPEFAWGWAALALLHVDNSLFRIDCNSSDAADHALYCIRQALTSDAECALAHFTQGIYHLMRGEVEQCAAAAERAVEFAHGSPFETAGGGGLLAMTGESARSQPLIDWSIHTNPGLPGWVHWATTVNQFKHGDYRQALLVTQRYSLPDCFWDHLFRAAANFFVGDNEQAKSAMKQAQQLRPALAEQPHQLVSRLVLQPDLRSILVDEVPRL